MNPIVVQRDALPSAQQLAITHAPPIYIPRENGTATFSACGRYRYSLERTTGIQGPNLAWLMLNPSTADATKDDPTIRKVIGFTRRAGYGVAMVANLFALRSTDPKNVRVALSRSLIEAVGPDNDEMIVKAALLSAIVVCAWGPKAWAQPRARRVVEMLRNLAGTRLLCIAQAKDGTPVHPLMQSYERGLSTWVPR